MLKNFWYAVEFADRVTTKPIKITVPRSDLALYRTPKTAVRSSCPTSACTAARRSPAVGPGGRDCIVCPYHGWEFEPDGAVHEDPGEPARPGHPEEGAGRLVPGAGEATASSGSSSATCPRRSGPPIPVWPEFDDLHGERRQVHARCTGEFLWKANYERILENGCDIAHAPFVHGGVFGNPEKPEVPEYELEIPDEWSAFATVVLHPPRPRASGRSTAKGDKEPEEPPAGATTRRLDAAEHDQAARPAVDGQHDHLRHQHPDRRDDHAGQVGRSCAPSSPGKWANKNAIAARPAKIFYQDAEVVEQRPPRAAAVRPRRGAARQERPRSRCTTAAAARSWPTRAGCSATRTASRVTCRAARRPSSPRRPAGRTPSWPAPGCTRPRATTPPSRRPSASARAHRRGRGRRCGSRRRHRVRREGHGQ